MAKESNGKIISLLKEVLAKVGGGSGEPTEVENEYYTSSKTYDVTGKGTFFIYTTSLLSNLEVDGVVFKKGYTFMVSAVSNSYYVYKVPYHKSVKFTTANNTNEVTHYKGVIL